jgi:hypothetical protein
LSVRLVEAGANAYLPGHESQEADVNGLARFLGDSPLRVFLKLVVISFLVGIVMSAFGWSPLDVLEGIRDFFVDLWNMGFRAVDRFASYLLLGAAIVIPAFIILRLFSYRR